MRVDRGQMLSMRVDYRPTGVSNGARVVDNKH